MCTVFYGISTIWLTRSFKKADFLPPSLAPIADAEHKILIGSLWKNSFFSQVRWEFFMGEN